MSTHISQLDIVSLPRSAQLGYPTDLRNYTHDPRNDPRSPTKRPALHDTTPALTGAAPAYRDHHLQDTPISWLILPQSGTISMSHTSAVNNNVYESGFTTSTAPYKTNTQRALRCSIDSRRFSEARTTSWAVRSRRPASGPGSSLSTSTPSTSTASIVASAHAIERALRLESLVVSQGLHANLSLKMATQYRLIQHGDPPLRHLG
ncbi:hypothetical protein PLICRDRAFT_180612 [Plicaturopsis crispa FD-325 SS-3]|uniref:Uncharacterized protein n=1 Tax=Plicaturopsis crispa FD-325 SS-3 TaxID=944288 RepID=A0A0C9SVT2_PLICR|nr:hypothetical protein PLICRDRAFT_180612 [Plicaturopsis crispa FD-325 SS-3]